MPPNFEPRLPTPPPTPPAKPSVPSPVPNPLNQSHSMPVGEQHTIDVNKLPRNSNEHLFQSSAPQVNSSYDFMLNPTPPAKNKINLPKGNLGKAIAVLGGVIAIIIVISVISSLLKGPSNVPYLDNVLADQQEIMHISNEASNASDISNGNQNFISTAYYVLSSNKTQLQTYLVGKNGTIKPLILNSRVSKTTDNQLSNAESAGDFNSTFAGVAKDDLNLYLQDLSAAYNRVKGPHGRALLVSFYKQAKLLLVSLTNGS